MDDETQPIKEKIATSLAFIVHNGAGSHYHPSQCLEPTEAAEESIKLKDFKNHLNFSFSFEDFVNLLKKDHSPDDNTGPGRLLENIADTQHEVKSEVMDSLLKSLVKAKALGLSIDTEKGEISASLINNTETDEKLTKYATKLTRLAVANCFEDERGATNNDKGAEICGTIIDILSMGKIQKKKQLSK